MAKKLAAKRTLTPERPSTKYSIPVICIALTVLTLVVYLPVGGYDFVNYDDDIYVYQNRFVQQGFSADTLRWAFSTSHTGNWHPLTWLSLMLDHAIFGLNPGGYHITNLLFHIVNTLLLFLIFEQMTGILWRSVFVAALFGLHPMHVESVAWVAERKDVLSALFWMLTIWAYLRYVRLPNTRRMVAVVVFFALGLMAKPMLVTLPFVLLLLDFWPLERYAPVGRHGRRKKPFSWVSAVVEKIPLFILSGLSSVVTLWVQQSGGNVASLEDIALANRLANSVSAYLDYFVKLVWPVNLAVLYPYQYGISVWKLALSTMFVVGITVMALKWKKTHPYVSVGWLWYLGTLVPVIGLVQVGNHSIADRYTYIPYVGIFLMIAWGLPELFKRLGLNKKWLIAPAAVAVVLMLILSRIQVGYWKDSITLLTHTLSVTENNFLPHNNLGAALIKAGRLDEAEVQLREAIRIKPDYSTPHNNLGLVLYEKGAVKDAVEYFQEAIRIDEQYAPAHFNLANALLKQGSVAAAIKQYNEALRIDPHFVNAHYNLANALVSKGQVVDAIEHYRQALEIQPGMLKARINLGNTLGMKGRIDEAIEQFETALRVDPGYADAHNNLGIALMNKGLVNRAIIHFRRATEIDPLQRSYRDNLYRAITIEQQRK